MLRNKKLERQLLAAGIFYKIDSTYLNVYAEDPSTSGDVDYSKTYPLGELRTNINWFECIKQDIGFKGNGWDGLLERLRNEDSWVENRAVDFYPRSVFENDYAKGNTVQVPRIIFNFTFNNPLFFVNRGEIENAGYKPHQIWKLLDKIDAAKAKGGKQTVKFKGNEYEFDFPSVETKPLVKVTKKGIELSGRFEGDVVVDDVIFNQDNLIIEECNEHTEEQLKELIPATLKGKRAKRIAIDKTLRTMTKEEKESEKGKALIQQRRLIVKAYNNQCEEIRKQEPKEPAWKSVTGWDSVKDNCVNGLLYYNSSDGKQPKVSEAKYRYPNYFATEKQAQQILALSQLTQIHKAMIDSSSTVDKEFGGVMFVGENTLRLWTLDISKKGTEEGQCNFIKGKNKAFGYKPSCSPFEFEFYTREQADHFVKHNADLIDQYLGYDDI